MKQLTNDLYNQDEVDLTGDNAPVEESKESTMPDEVIVNDTEPQAQPEEETVVEQPEVQTQEPTTETQPEESSLQTDPDTPPQEEPEISQERVLEFLSEKLGKEITSFDDLTKEPEPQEVSNPLDEVPQLKEIYDWAKKTGRPIADWAKYQKDYDKMSNIDVAREILQLEYSDFTPEEIQLELQEFLPSEDDIDEDTLKKGVKLKKFATDARRKLNSMKLEFSNPAEGTGQPSLSQEQQEAVSFYNTYKENQGNQSKMIEDYNKTINKTVSEIKSIPLKLSDDLSINYNLTDEDKKSLPDMISTMPHWYNEDGSYNHSAIVEDAAKIKNFNTILKTAFDQGVSHGQDQEDKVSKNITLDRQPTIDSKSHGDKQEIIVEGGDSFGSGFGKKFGFKSRRK